MREYLESWIALIEKTVGLSPELQAKILISLILIFTLWLFRKLILKIEYLEIKSLRRRYLWQKFSGYILVGIGFIAMVWVWFEEVVSLSTFLGLLSAGLAIVLKDPLVNFAGWAYILWRNPFEVGDRIQVGAHAGDVVDQRVLQFTILEIGNWVDADQSTGRIIHIPNGKVFTDSVANYTQGFQYIWNEIPVPITFESNWKKAKDILQKIATRHEENQSELARQRLEEAGREVLIFYSKLTPTVYTSLKENGVILTIRYLCEPRRRRGTAEAIWEDVLEEFGKCDDIMFAYPTQRFYTNFLEGKPGTKPPKPAPEPDKEESN